MDILYEGLMQCCVHNCPAFSVQLHMIWLCILRLFVVLVATKSLQSYAFKMPPTVTLGSDQAGISSG